MKNTVFFKLVTQKQEKRNLNKIVNFTLTKNLKSQGCQNTEYSHIYNMLNVRAAHNMLTGSCEEELGGADLKKPVTEGYSQSAPRKPSHSFTLN